MAITTLNLRGLNRSDTATSGQVVTATSATAADFQNADGAKIGQVLQTVVTAAGGAVSGSQGNWTEISAFQRTITPAATSSTILIWVDAAFGITADYSLSLKLVRGSTDIYVGDAASNRLRAAAGGWIHATAAMPKNTIGPFLDSPSSTSELTYKVYISSENGSTTYLNRSLTDTDATWNRRGASSLTVMEVLA